MVTVCQEMGWTYFEYMNQPSWFLELVWDKISLDSETRKKQMKKHG